MFSSACMALVIASASIGDAYSMLAVCRACPSSTAFLIAFMCASASSRL